MKRALMSVSALGLFLSSVSFALPARSDEVLLALLTQNSDFAELLSAKIASQPGPFKASFEGVKAERVDGSDEVRELCQEFSKSGSYYKVTLTGAKGGTYYFSTGESPDALKLCK